MVCNGSWHVVDFPEENPKQSNDKISPANPFFSCAVEVKMEASEMDEAC